MRFSLFFFLNVIAILILLIVQPHASAEDDEWYIEDFGGFIVTAVPGEVVHGDKLRFVINKTNCNKLSIMFSFLSYKNPKRLPSLQGRQVPFRINGSKTLLSADILLVKPAFGNNSYFVMFSTPEFYLIDEMSAAIMKAYRSKNKFSIELGKVEEFNPEDYFDIYYNNWILDKYPEKISEAREMCEGKILLG